MRQLIETDQSDLRALPVEDRGVELQVRELDLAGAWPTPFVGSVVCDTAELGIEVQKVSRRTVDGVRCQNLYRMHEVDDRRSHLGNVPLAVATLLGKSYAGDDFDPPRGGM
jgi:hypothetical protein